MRGGAGTATPARFGAMGRGARAAGQRRRRDLQEILEGGRMRERRGRANAAIAERESWDARIWIVGSKSDVSHDE